MWFPPEAHQEPTKWVMGVTTGCSDFHVKKELSSPEPVFEYPSRGQPHPVRGWEQDRDFLENHSLGDNGFMSDRLYLREQG